MEMSKAAIAPQQPLVLDQDRKHPLFPEYDEHRRFCNANLVRADSFRDWLASRERQLRDDEIRKHPKFPEFQKWMRENKGGRRKCPAGNAFPANFHFWLEGGRW